MLMQLKLSVVKTVKIGKSVLGTQEKAGTIGVTTLWIIQTKMIFAVMQKSIKNEADLFLQDEVRFWKEEVDPILIVSADSTATHKCPFCGTEVAGYIKTISENWDYHKDKFCSQCGVKIKWERE